MLDTLANVKTRLGITTDSDDAFLIQQVNLISDVIEAYCRRKFNLSSWVETFYWDNFYNLNLNNNKLVLYHFPVVDVTALTLDGIAFDVTELRIHKPTATLKRKDCCDLYRREVVVSYTAGYSTIPSPILEVLDSLVSERYNKKKSGVDLNFGSDVQSISIPGAISIAFDYTLANNDRTSSYGVIIGNYANVLDDWRSERTVTGSGKLEYVEPGV